MRDDEDVRCCEVGHNIIDEADLISFLNRCRRFKYFSLAAVTIILTLAHKFQLLVIFKL